MNSDHLRTLRELWERPERYLLVVPDALPPNAAPEASQFAMIASASSLACITVECSEADTLELLRRMRASGVRVLSSGEFRARLSTVRGAADSPAHACASEFSAARHVRLSDGRFQLVVAGPARAIHAGFEHILVVEALAAALSHYAADDVQIVDAVVFDPASGSESRAYKEVLPRHELTPQSLAESAYLPVKAWHFRREALFLAQPVPTSIANFPGVALYPGFSQYAGRY